jgi:dolichol-phosphate mannosyltransferase
MFMRPPDLTVVIPTYNERDGIAELVTSLFAECRAADLDVEVVVVDDNSPDGTGAVADELRTRYRVSVVHREGKLGLGTAVMAGFAVAAADVVGVMDADFSHPPALVPRLYAAFRATGADVVVASRYIPGGGTPNWPFQRRVLSRVGCLLARPLSPIRDPASGFFLIHRALAQAVDIKAGGFKIGLELIVRGEVRSLVEVPYRFHDRRRGVSKMNTTEAVGYLRQLGDLYTVAWSRRRRFTYRQLTSRDVDVMASQRNAGRG